MFSTFPGAINMTHITANLSPIYNQIIPNFVRCSVGDDIRIIYTQLPYIQHIIPIQDLRVPKCNMPVPHVETSMFKGSRRNRIRHPTFREVDFISGPQLSFYECSSHSFCTTDPLCFLINRRPPHIQQLETCKSLA